MFVWKWTFIGFKLYDADDNHSQQETSDRFQRQWELKWASLIAQMVKNLPAMQETAVWFLGQEDLLEKG